MILSKALRNICSAKELTRQYALVMSIKKKNVALIVVV